MRKSENGRIRKNNKKAEVTPTKTESQTTSKGSFYAVCIGASAGGLNAVTELVSQLAPDLNAAVFVVLHFSREALGQILVDRIQRHSRLHCTIARDGDPITPGIVYVAAPDSHLLIKDSIILGHGPAENRFRPSIDILFKSAAAYYNSYAVGIVLTGMLNDGTAGICAIKQSGGHCIVQDPDEAEYPDMPISVLQAVQVDYLVKLEQMGASIQEIVNKKKRKRVAPPAIVVAESKLSEKAATAIEKIEQLGRHSIYSCPDCGGGLFKIKNGRSVHYRCYIGHSYSEDDLIVKQSEAIEHTLWVAVQMMEERKLLFMRLARENGEKGLQRLARNYHSQANQFELHIAELKKLLLTLQKE
jgi:two-component system chemotaxis response regulator CheB